jgi:hypothetical protein
MVNIKNILKKEPTLTPLGIEGQGTFHLDNPNFEADDIKQIETCINWLSAKAIDASINRDVTSYSIKHIIERELNTYIANGCFIAAVIHLGIPYKKKTGSPNVYVAISSDELYKNDPDKFQSCYIDLEKEGIKC